MVWTGWEGKELPMVTGDTNGTTTSCVCPEVTFDEE